MRRIGRTKATYIARPKRGKVRGETPAERSARSKAVKLIMGKKIPPLTVVVVGGIEFYRDKTGKVIRLKGKAKRYYLPEQV